jgi:hypothetical protein
VFDLRDVFQERNSGVKRDLPVLISVMLLLHSHSFLLLNCSMPCGYGSLHSQEYYISLYSAMFLMIRVHVSTPYIVSHRI